jgi:hypothetical protein
VWDYDDGRQEQRLVRLIALCPACHEVKHLGLAAKRGRHAASLAHLAKVNGWTTDDAEAYAEVVKSPRAKMKPTKSVLAPTSAAHGQPGDVGSGRGGGEGGRPVRAVRISLSAVGHGAEPFA